MRIDVTAEDIAKGARGSCVRCPITRALRRITGVWWVVNPSLAMNRHGKEFVLPPEAVAFVSDFDDGKDVLPFSFEVSAR